MGQSGSTQLAPAPRPLPHHRADTLPHEPPRRAPKVLPSLAESPRLRCTDNGVILHSGGTISGRRPLSNISTSHRGHHHHHGHSAVYRSRSATGEQSGDHRHSHERDMIYRSHTNLDLRDPADTSSSKLFGSEPDLRVDEDQPKQRCANRHFRKKYKAPPPPAVNNRDGSSPDSFGGNNQRVAPPRKLRLFKTRTETKNTNSQFTETKPNPGYRHLTEDTSVGQTQTLDRNYKPSVTKREQCLKYPDSRDKDMVQSSISLRIEENIIQTSDTDIIRKRKTELKTNDYKAKAMKSEQNSSSKTPRFDRTFRHSERFIREESEQPILRREKSFDATLLADKHETSMQSPNHRKLLNEQLQEKYSNGLVPERPLRKSLPSLLAKNNEDKDEFHEELKRATSKIRNEVNKNVKKAMLGNQVKTSHNSKPACTPHKGSIINHSHIRKPVTNDKLKISSPKLCNKNNGINDPKISRQDNAINRRALSRTSNVNSRDVNRTPLAKQNNVKSKIMNGQDNKACGDRGQASGKESTPEHSPTRSGDTKKQIRRDKPVPSKQFYFGMIESKDIGTKDNLKDFPGLGTPIIEEMSNFHLIEKKLLNYREDVEQKEAYPTTLPLKEPGTKNLSSESALSSSEEEAGSDNSLGIALRLRPTIPKKQLEVPRFSPAAAWRQLAQLDAQPEIQPLAVETKVPHAEPAAESPIRSEKSGDKSGDSGISGDHANSDERLDSPSHGHVCVGGTVQNNAWTPQQDLGDSSSDGAGGRLDRESTMAGHRLGESTMAGHRLERESAMAGHGGLVTYSARGQPFSLSLPREVHPDKTKQFQQPFNSLQKLKKSVSGALGAALGARRFDLEHEPMLDEPEQNWFLTKSAPNSLTNPLLYPQKSKGSNEDDIKEESPAASEPEEKLWKGSGGLGTGSSYLSWGGHVMYLPPGPADGRGAARHVAQPLSLLATFDRPLRSKSSGELEHIARAARAARAGALSSEMRERERSASPAPLARALPARVHSSTNTTVTTSRSGGSGGSRKPKRFTFQSTVRQLERRRLAEKLSREADLKEQQRLTELEAMRRVEEEFQRKRAREKASIRQQLRLVSGTTSLPPLNSHSKGRDDPDGAVSRESPPISRDREPKSGRRSNASSEISGRSKSTTPVRCVELSEWREAGSGSGCRQYRDWGAAHPHNIDHPPACARMPPATAPHTTNHLVLANSGECEAFSGSPRSDNYRLEFARGVPRSPRSPRTPRAPRMHPAPSSPSSSGSDMSARHRIQPQPIRLRETVEEESVSEPAIIPKLLPSIPPATSILATR